jgi:hypothetical protein
VNAMDAELVPIEYVSSLFKEYPLANDLLSEVVAFYRDSLVIRSAAIADDSSRYTLDVDAQHLKFNRAIIKLNTSTNRQAAAACHELLHLQLPLRKFSRIRPLESRPVHPNAETSVTNVVHHDIFKDNFTALGFSLEQFLTRSKESINYKKLARDPRNQTTPYSVLWSWWCIEYLRHYISISHGSKDSGRLADKVAKWGDKAVPKFKQGMALIRQWLSDGKHRQSTEYAVAMQKLFDIIQLPKITGFYSLDMDSNNQIILRAAQ